MNAFTDRALAAGQYPSTPGFQEPTTSKAAAAKIAGSAGALRRRTLERISSAPSTADEVADFLHVDRLAIRPRVSELRKLGYVEPVRKMNGAQERRTNESGNAAIVWKITAAGTAALTRETAE